MKAFDFPTPETMPPWGQAVHGPGEVANYSDALGILWNQTFGATWWRRLGAYLGRTPLPTSPGPMLQPEQTFSLRS
jgi:hypothetical protein